MHFVEVVSRHPGLELKPSAMLSDSSGKRIVELWILEAETPGGCVY